MNEYNYIINNVNNKIFNTREEADIYAEQILKLKEYVITDIKSNQTWEYTITKTGYKYRLTSTQASSNKYGKCKCCGEYASEVFYQVEQKYFKFEENGEIEEGYTCYQCNNYFGHKECLKAKRR